MTLEEFYIQIGSNADAILERFGDQAFIKKFIIKFLDDPTFQMLKEDVENNNIDKANFDAHTLKGVCALLDFINLKQLIEQFVLCIKQGNSYNEVWQRLSDEYNFIIQTIKQTNWIIN